MVKSAKFLCAFLFLATVAAAHAQGSAPAAETQFNVAAKTYSVATYNIVPGVTNVRLTGSFKATGGTASDIIVIVMNDAQFAKWKTGKPCVGPGNRCTPENGGALYNSGPVTEGIINLALPNGAATYHLVFNNQEFEYAKTILDDLKWQWGGGQGQGAPGQGGPSPGGPVGTAH
jgi:hypothetical protein